MSSEQSTTTATPTEATVQETPNTTGSTTNNTGNGTPMTRTRDTDRRNPRGHPRGIPNTFTGAQHTVGAVIGTKEENGPKNSFEAFQDAIMAYVSDKYSKGTDLAPMIRDLKVVDISGEEPDMVLERDANGKE